MIDFKPLASGSGGNAYIVDDGQTRLLLEAGLKIKELRKRADFSLSQIQGCLISHEHGDHACGARDVAKVGIDIYASNGTAQALNLSGHRVNRIRAKEQVQIGTWAVLPFDTVHDAQEPLGFLLANQGGEKLLFATDTAYIKYRFQGVTHIAIEANFDSSILKQNVTQGHVPHDVGKRLWGRHMSLEAVKKFMSVNDLSKVQEIHLLHLSDKNSDADLFRSEIERQTGRPTYI